MRALLNARVPWRPHPLQPSSYAPRGGLTKIRPRIARRGIESSERLGRYRWVVERTFAWLHRFRRLIIRYERRADISSSVPSMFMTANVVVHANVGEAPATTIRGADQDAVHGGATFGLGGGFWLARRYDLLDEEPVLLVFGAIGAVVVAALVGASGRGAGQPAVENRDPSRSPWTSGPSRGA